MTDDSTRNDWFVGASRGGTEDMTDELVREGIWRYWPGPKGNSPFEDKIRAMKPGDRIAIKSAYVRKHDLPFDNRGNSVSVMAIKAIGEITENLGDGLRVRVDWKQRFDPPREWYFYTARFSVWKMKKNSWAAKELTRFAFEGENQDIERFLRDPFWQQRYGDSDGSRFAWANFYQAFADRLAEFHNRREELILGLERLSQRLPWLNYLHEPDSSRESGFLEDICPFTFMGAFNRGMTVENRRSVAAALADLIGLEAEAPESFDGIPVMNNQSAWFFAFKARRQPADIDGLWAMFRTALQYADAREGEDYADQFTTAFDRTVLQRKVAWTLTMGLYWIRPWEFVPLDRNTRQYLKSSFGIDLPHKIGEERFDGSDYLDLIEDLKARFVEDDSPVRSIPELSFAAWGQARVADEPQDDYELDDAEEMSEAPVAGESEPYGLEDIEAEGCFLPKEDLEKILKRIRVKKNAILQGAPGTGKTWLSKRLGYALMGQRDERRLTAVQFHPTLSYEDFVRGWRPAAGGRLTLSDGPLMQAIRRSAESPDSLHVVVIEEINRGNPAQIFGEMLTLIEGDKRKPDDALRLSHMHEGESPIHVPANLYLIGTMNIADRSLALVDLALRRRFAFIDLAPHFNQAWADWLENEGGIDRRLVDDIGARIRKLNDTITADGALGSNYCVGHSYVTPGAGDRVRDPVSWFQAVVETEIGPLLEEYWFDRPERAREETDRLLAGW